MTQVPRIILESNRIPSNPSLVINGTDSVKTPVFIYLAALTGSSCDCGLMRQRFIAAREILRTFIARLVIDFKLA